MSRRDALRRHYTYPGVPVKRRLELRRFAQWLGATYPVRGPHRLFVTVVNAACLTLPDDCAPPEGYPDGCEGFAFGAFTWPPKGPRALAPYHFVHIYIAGATEIEDGDDLSQPTHIRYGWLLETLAHEWGHYLQWVEEREPDEDDAERFAADAVRAYQALYTTTPTARPGAEE